MEEKGIIKFENEYFTLTYVKGSTRVGLDTEKMKKEIPDIYERYGKTTQTKAGLRIKFKGE